MAATQATLNAVLDRMDLPMAHEIGLEFVPQCHPKAGLTARYFSGIVFLACARCKTRILECVLARTSEDDWTERRPQPQEAP
jgi:hypothetical protein